MLKITQNNYMLLTEMVSESVGKPFVSMLAQLLIGSISSLFGIKALISVISFGCFHHTIYLGFPWSSLNHCAFPHEFAAAFMLYCYSSNLTVSNLHMRIAKINLKLHSDNKSKGHLLQAQKPGKL